MPDRERRAATSSSSTHRTTGVRRNLFQQHLTRRPTTSSTSTSAETLRLDVDHESDSSDIVIRDKNGEFEIEELSVQPFDEQDEGVGEVGEDESWLPFFFVLCCAMRGYAVGLMCLKGLC